jgi:hypothetical protein
MNNAAALEESRIGGKRSHYWKRKRVGEWELGVLPRPVGRAGIKPVLIEVVSEEED